MGQHNNRLLDDLDDRQRQVATHLIGPLCVHAGAGTGKTRAMTYRIAHGIAQGVYHPHQVMALTFTKKASSEMTARLQTLRANGVKARTFHAAALSQLRYFWPTAVGGAMPKLMASKSSLVAYAALSANAPSDKAAIRDIASEIEWSRVRMIAEDEYVETVEALGRPMPAGLTADKMAAVLRAYAHAKIERRVMDFEDVLLATLGMLQEREDIAQQVRQQYQHFIVDEYQDVSPVQQQLLDTWLGPRNNNLCVVGDAAQTIYSFAGASSTYLTGFHQRYPGAKVVELNRDYRSTPQIVSLANIIIDQGKRTDRELNSAVHLLSAKADGPCVSWHRALSDQEEADYVVSQIQSLVEGQKASYADIAVLFRTNAQSRLFEQSLAEAGIGFILHGGVRFFEREEIGKAMNLIEAHISHMGAARIAACSAGEEMRAIVERLGWTAQQPAAEGAVRDRWEALQALIQLADEREEEGLSLNEVFAELKDRRENQAALQVNGITLSSLHAAKGLEWKAVFLVGCSEGLLPIKQAKRAEEINEERRLAYVGVTRAQEYLHIVYAASRHEGGSANRKISRFFAAQEPLKRAYAMPAKKTGKRVKKDTKEFLEEADQPTVDRFEALRTWRYAVAREVNRPAFTIFPDATLQDLAEACPKTLQQLAVIRGIGAVKRKLFGADVLALLRGAQPQEIAERTAVRLKQQMETIP